MGRKKIINIRVTESEHAKLTALGKSFGGISALIRENLILRNPDSSKREALLELIRLARNLNLIARRARGYEPVHAVEAIACLAAIDRQVSAAMETLVKKRSI